MNRSPSPEPSTTPTAPVDRPRLSDNVYNQLLQEITSGQWPLGSRLPPETQLARRFAVSRPVVREALHRLQSDGVVLSRQGSGSYVQRSPMQRVSELTRQYSLHDVLQGFEVRMALETLAARLAARNRSAEQLRHIEATAEDMARALRARGASGSAEARQATREADYAFHRAIVLASSNVVLLDAIELLADRVQGGMNVTLALTRESSRQRRERVLDEHQRIVNAIRVSDPDSAAIAMQYHLDQARNRLLDRQVDR